jgi:hypothetical protein
MGFARLQLQLFDGDAGLLVLKPIADATVGYAA